MKSRPSSAEGNVDCAGALKRPSSLWQPPKSRLSMHTELTTYSKHSDNDGSSLDSGVHHTGMGTSWWVRLYSLCKCIRPKFLLNILRYIHAISNLTKDLNSGFSLPNFLFFALNDHLMTLFGTQSTQILVFCFYHLPAQTNDLVIDFYYILTFWGHF